MIFYLMRKRQHVYRIFENGDIVYYLSTWYIYADSEYAVFLVVI